MTTLFDRPRPTIDARFDAWISANPEILRLFLRFAREARAAGHRRYSADAILHRIRWEVTIERRGEFKCNNNATAYLARMVMRMYPEEFADFFETRQLRSSAA